MNLRLTQIDTLANNLANVDATGFKQVLTRVTERAADGAAGSPHPRRIRPGLSIRSG